LSRLPVPKSLSLPNELFNRAFLNPLFWHPVCFSFDVICELSPITNRCHIEGGGKQKEELFTEGRFGTFNGPEQVKKI